MWREQLGLPPLDGAAGTASLTPVDVGGEKGKLSDLIGTHDGQPDRMINAFVQRADGDWFYRLEGSEAAVASQKDIFIDFLKTVRMTAGSGSNGVTENKPPPEPPAPAAHMVAPEGWQEQTPGRLQVAKFSAEKNGGKADVSVSVFDSDTGGTLANVNRWRQMIGLQDVDEAGLQECTSSLGEPTIAGAPGAVLADFSNDTRRFLGAIVPREGRWWFYKMVGDAAVVNAEHDTFVQFVKSQP
jgi:hypothetical protein